MARKLSVSRAWDETRNVIGRDGRLLAIVALALMVLPGTVQTLVSPEAPAGKLPEPGAWMVVALVAIVIGLVGQLAVVRLAIGPQTSVGEAIGHGARRMPAYLASILLWILPIVGVIVLLVRIIREPNPPGAALVGFFVLLAVLVFLAVRMLLAAPVASAENVGPVGILRRSWQLTAGSWWRLFGFLVLFIIAAVIVMIAVEATIGLLVGIVFGTPEPMSVGALLVALATQLAVAAVTVVFLVMLARIYLQRAVPEPAHASVPSSGT